MSRVGRKIIEIPSGVEVTINGKEVTAKGPKGTLTQTLSDRVTIKVDDNNIVVDRINDEKYARADHGLYRSLIANMIEGVSKGFTKELEVEGVGFKVAMDGKGLKMSLGFSHQVKYQPEENVTLAVDNNKITVTGASKQLVGQTAADIRSLKKPEPYKGKGIKYVGEQIIRKSGKAAGGGE